MQRLQHQSVAAERDHDVRLFRIVVAVERNELCQRLLGLCARTSDEGDLLISRGGGHGIAGLTGAPMKAVRRGRLYDLAGPCRDDRPALRGGSIYRSFDLESAIYGK